MAENIGALTVIVGADITGLTSALGQADKHLDTVAGRMRGTVNTAGKLALAASAAGAAVATALVARSMDAIDTQAKLARQLRATNAGLATLMRAGDLAGVGQEKMTIAVRQLDTAIGEAIQGTQEYKEAFDRLGLSAEAVSRLDVDQRIAAINRALKENVPAAERAAVAGALFGRRLGLAMTEIDPETLGLARDEVVRLGLAVSEVDSTTIERANDQLSVLGKIAEGAGNRLAVAVAPIIDDITNRIRSMALETEGFKTTIDRAMQAAVNGAANVADVVQGLRVVLKGVELGFQLFGDSVLAIVGAIVKGWMEIANLIPGIDIKFEDSFLGILLDQSAARIKETKAELVALANQPMPGEGLKQWFDEVKARSNQVSEEVVRTRKAAAGMGEGGIRLDPEAQKRLEAFRESLRTEEESERASHAARLAELNGFLQKRQVSQQEFDELLEKEVARHRDALAQIDYDAAAEERALHEERMGRFQSLRDELADEEKLETERFEDKMRQLQEFRELEFSTEEEHKELMASLEEDHWQRSREIRERAITTIEQFQRASFRRQAQHLAGMITDMTANVTSGSRAMFNINKIAGIAQIALKTPEAIANAYTWGAAFGGPPAGAAMATLAGVAMLAQMNQIRAQQFGGGGGAAPSLAGATPATPVTPVASGSGSSQAGPTTIVQLPGTEFTSTRAVRDLFEKFIETQRDGGRLILARGRA